MKALANLTSIILTISVFLCGLSLPQQKEVGNRGRDVNEGNSEKSPGPPTRGPVQPRKSAARPALSLSVRLKSVDRLVEQGQLSEARAELDSLLDQYDDKPQVFYKSYEVFLQLNRLREAEYDLLEAIDLTTKVTEKAAWQAKLEELKTQQVQFAISEEELARQKKEAEEKAALAKIQAEEKANRLAFVQRRLEEGDEDKAKEELSRLAADYSTDADLLYKTSGVAASLGQFDVAERWLDSSISMTTDETDKSLRRREKLELKYKREKAHEAQLRQGLAVQFKKLMLMAKDGRVNEVQAELETILTARSEDPEVYYMAHEVLTNLGNFVIAESYLNKSTELTKDAKTKNERSLQLIEFNYKRERAAEGLVASVEGIVNQMKYAEAEKALGGMGNITVYNQKGYILRGGIAGLYRRYDQAAKDYERVLQDASLPAAARAKVENLRDYCQKRIADGHARRLATKSCHFCHAELAGRAAYCHQCLAFQYPVNFVQEENARANFSWSGGLVTGVTYQAQNFKRKDLQVVSESVGVVGRPATSASPKSAANVASLQQEVKSASRNFQLKYEQRVPVAVDFRSSADGTLSGQITTSYVSPGEQAWAAAELDSSKEVFKLEDLLMYPSALKVDPLFAQIAFGHYLTRGFAPNWNFDPYVWQEPHVFVFSYDEKSRVTRAVDCYVYSDEATTAGHIMAKSRKPFNGPDWKDPFGDNFARSFDYNDEGLMSAIRATYKGREYYRREIGYGPDGIMQEREFMDGTLTALRSYKWKKGALLTAKVDNKRWKDQAITFHPVIVQQPQPSAVSQSQAKPAAGQNRTKK